MPAGSSNSHQCRDESEELDGGTPGVQVGNSGHGLGPGYRKNTLDDSE